MSCQMDMDALETVDPSGVLVDRDIWHRDYDITIFGATGYTGQLCIQQLDMTLSQPGATAHRWAIAGRDARKLRAIAKRCRTKPDVVQVTNLEEMSQMCHNTYVVLSLAGPYIKMGEPLVKLCVQQWTHYIDVSGEAVWIHRMIEKYHQEAKARGVIIINSCGQESAPYEIMGYELVKLLGPLKQLRFYMFMYGFISGGTYATGMAGMENLMQNADDFALSQHPFNLGGERKCGVRREDKDMTWVEQDPYFPSLWLFPFSESNTQVRTVRRSCALFEEASSKEVQYGENFLTRVSDAAPKEKGAEIGLASSPPLQDPGHAQGALHGMYGNVMQGGAPQPGLGSTEQMRGLYCQTAYAVAEGEGGEWAHIRHTGPDTYEVTAICAVAGALTLAEELRGDHTCVKPTDRGGVVTPAYAFHNTRWLERVRQYPMAGTKHRHVVFDVKRGMPQDAELKEAMQSRSMHALKGMAAQQKGDVKAWDMPPLSTPQETFLSLHM